MIKILVSCANGSGTSLMLRNTVDKVFKELNRTISDIHHCAISEGKSIAGNYNIVFCSLNFLDMFKDAEAKGITVIGIKNVMSAPEVKEKLLASGVLDKLED